MKTKVNGIQLAYDINGNKAPAILLIHGFGLDRSIWMDLTSAHLGEQLVILPDLRGHGESDAIQGPYLMSTLAEDLALLLDILSVEKAIVCGHSMGGYVALAFAEQYPHRLAGLGLITTNAQADSDEKRSGRYAMIEQVKQHGSLAVAKSLAPRLSDDQTIVQQAHRLIHETDPDGLIGALGGMAERPDRRELLTKIDVPALVVAGEADQITDLDEAKVMAESLPRGEFLALPGAGHMPMAEACAELGLGLRSLIQRVMTLPSA